MREQKPDCQQRHRRAVLRHAEEVTGNVTATCRCYGISRTCSTAGSAATTPRAIDSLTAQHRRGSWGKPISGTHRLLASSHRTRMKNSG